jgi:hypothetical protein
MKLLIKAFLSNLLGFDNEIVWRLDPRYIKVPGIFFKEIRIMRKAPEQKWFVYRHKETGKYITNEHRLPSDHEKSYEKLNPKEHTFVGVMEFISLWSSRNSYGASFKCLETDDVLNMSGRQFNKIVKLLDSGIVMGEWRFEKHGNSVLIYLNKTTED